MRGRASLRCAGISASSTRIRGGLRAKPPQCTQDAVVLVTRAEEKKQILGGLARIPDLMALALTERYLEDEEVRDDGVLSFLQVAESIAGTPSR